MLTLSYPQPSTKLQDIEEQLQSVALAYKAVQQADLTQPKLEDGLQTVEGEAAIQKYVEQLLGEMGQWWYCSC